MRRIFGLLAIASAAAAVVAVGSPSVSADPPTPIGYGCHETTVPTVGFPSPSVQLTVTIVDTPDPARVFQPVTWRTALSNPDLPTPLPLAVHYLRGRVPIPDNLTGVTASVAAAPGTTPNPPLSQVSVRVTADEVIFQLPGTPSASRRIRAAASGLTYPYQEGSAAIGNPVVLPLIRISGVPTPAASGTTITWRAPEIDFAVTLPGGTATVTCAGTEDPDPAIVRTAVNSAVQTCDGQAVTVQTGFNNPTAGDDVIQGTSANNTVNGLGGNDRFCGLAGGDSFGGGTGNDRVLGGPGNDVLRGDAGNDYLQGDAGRDRLDGGANRDICNGGTQVDTASGCEVSQAIP